MSQPAKKPVKDKTASRRTAALKERLQSGGGKRMSLNLDGDRVRKLDHLVEAGVGEDHSSVIRTLIDKA